MAEKNFRNLKRPMYLMLDYIEKALVQRELLDAYRDTPAYQQNGNIGWITRAKRQATVEKRMVQILDELEIGDKYMKMDYRPQHTR